MDLVKLKDHLSRPDFQDLNPVQLNFPAYIYTYPARSEFELRKKIPQLVEDLKRPMAYQECLHLNLLSELKEYLETSTAFKKTRWQHALNRYTESQDSLVSYLADCGNSPEFHRFLQQKIEKHFSDSGITSSFKVFVLVTGIGAITPFLSAHSFILEFEKYAPKYHLIVFYPGTYENDTFKLFGQANVNHIYRATLLNTRL